MSDSNPFSLENKKIPGQQVYGLAKVYSQEEIDTLLKNYIPIPEHLIDEITIGTYIRFFKIDKGFKYGGIVVANNIKFENTKTGTKDTCLRYKTFSGGNTNVWTLYYSDIEKIYAKSDPTVVILYDSMKKTINSIQNNMTILKEHIVQLEKKVNSLTKKINK